MTTRRSVDPGEPRVRLNAPPDILATIPFLVGYHPTDSVVILGMCGRRLTFTARDDLPGEGAEVLPEQIEYLVQVVLRQGCDGVLVVGFGSDKRATPTVEAICAAYRDVDVTVKEALRVEDGRYVSYLCRNANCCPPEGVPYDPGASAVSAAWTLSGRVARRDRAEYEAQIQPAMGTVRESMQKATADAHARLVELVRASDDEERAEAALLTAGTMAIADALDCHVRGVALRDDQVAWLSVLVESISVRDIGWSLILGAGAALHHHRSIWQEVLHRAESDLMAAPACLFAFAAWRGGDGGIARLALDRALDVEPGYRMAELLYQVIAHAIPPSTMDGFPDLPLKRRRSARPRKRSSTRRARTRRK
jgi:hypothetical protein